MTTEIVFEIDDQELAMAHPLRLDVAEGAPISVRLHAIADLVRRVEQNDAERLARFRSMKLKAAAAQAERSERERVRLNQENWAEHRNRQGQAATLDGASAFADEALRKSARRQAVDELLADFEPEGFGKDEDDDPDEGLVRV